MFRSSPGGIASTSSDLVFLGFRFEQRPHVVALPHLLGEGGVAGDELAHLRLDLGEVLGRERLVAGEVVVEPVLDHRADGDLGLRPQGLHGLRQDVGAIVPDQFQAARVGTVEEFDAHIRIDQVVEVADPPVERHGDGALGEALGDALHDGTAGHRGVVAAGIAVGECQNGHRERVSGGSLLRTRQVSGFGFEVARGVSACGAV